MTDIPSSRSAAKAAGAKQYWTGLPCKRGHVGFRVAAGGCVQCRTDDSRNARRMKRATESGRLHLNALVRKWSHKKKGYPTPTRPSIGICECCGRPQGRKILALDHDHVTNAFRGWLCDQCNTALGLVADSIPVLYCLIAYLQRSAD